MRNGELLAFSCIKIILEMRIERHKYFSVKVSDFFLCGRNYRNSLLRAESAVYKIVLHIDNYKILFHILSLLFMYKTVLNKYFLNFFGQLGLGLIVYILSEAAQFITHMLKLIKDRPDLVIAK